MSKDKPQIVLTILHKSEVVLKNKTYKILNLIAKYVSHNKVIYEEELINDLAEMGFEINEIDTALYWLETMGIDINQSNEEFNDSKYVRVITKEENNSLTKDAMNYLYLLKKQGLIDSDMFEDIMEKVVVANLDIKIDIEEIKLLISLISFNSIDTTDENFLKLLSDDGEILYN